MRNFSAFNFIMIDTLEQEFSYEFCQFFQNSYFAEHLRRAASDDMSIAKLFGKVCCSLKWKIKGHQR